MDLDLWDAAIDRHKFNKISPPKGTAWCGCMGDRVDIVCVPDQLDPWYIELVVEFVQQFE